MLNVVRYVTLKVLTEMGLCYDNSCRLFVLIFSITYIIGIG